MDTLLNIYLHEKHVANLWLEDKYYCFKYITQDTPPISLSLPVREEPYTRDFAKPYFANLLPEGDVRTAIETRLGISRGDDFALLEKIGGDCAGAITIFPQGHVPFTNIDYTPLSPDELATLIKELPQNPLCAGRNKSTRLSLAGAQNKTTLFIKDEAYYVPENGAPSSHILKVPITNIEGIVDTVHNEIFVMMLAKEMGLNVPNVELVVIGGIPVFVTERYDRQVGADNKIQRILQEDFCQLMKLEPTVKYQNSGGPGFEECVGILRQYSCDYLTDIEQFLSWVAFNVVVGNADAHAKNISMLWGSDGLRLAPFYDMLSTSVYGANHDTVFAMSIGREYLPEKLTRANWKQFAEFLDISIKLVDKINSRIATVMGSASEKTLALFEERYEKNVTVSRIAHDVEVRKNIFSASFGTPRHLLAAKVRDVPDSKLSK